MLWEVNVLFYGYYSIRVYYQFISLHLMVIFWQSLLLTAMPQKQINEGNLLQSYQVSFISVWDSLFGAMNCSSVVWSPARIS